ncbi:exocyst complex protein exo70 [Xylariales sp. PMI_506]|nr:exocyst complex protein exo70 [Xylariales sp. PMI_506]
MKAKDSNVLHRSLRQTFKVLTNGDKGKLYFDDQTVIDASGGAAVACIGHGDKRVQQAIIEQLEKVAYCLTTFYTTEVCEELCKTLIKTTNGAMSRAYIVSSGSEAMEAAMKLARQYFLEKDGKEVRRTRFIARHFSYHGTTLGSLSMGGHVARRENFEPMLLTNISKVSPCFPYRYQGGKSDEEYVESLATDLDVEFKRYPGEVCAFVAEPIVGAALGCVPAPPGYFKAMKKVCESHGALLILDEVMCGMGRTGTMHAWQQEDVIPDIQTIGKCLGGGYQPIAGVLVNHKVVEALENGSGAFVHGHTYQAHPVACAAALQVQKIIQEDRLIDNVEKLGPKLEELLVNKLGNHPNVGDIRGRGFFWGIEFVADKESKTPFPSKNGVAMEIAEIGLQETYGIAIYPGTGTANGTDGDHIIVSPPYNATPENLEEIAARAEVDVLNSRLEKTTQLTKKIQACLGRLEATGKSVRDVSGPLNGETKRLQILGNNIDSVIAAIERLRQPADSKDDEEQIIRQGPDKAGLSNYLNSIQRLSKALQNMETANMRANQQTKADLQRLIQTGNSSLENHFDKILRGETPMSVEPLNFTTKSKPFPVISQDVISRLSLINSYVGSNATAENPLLRIYADIRGQYMNKTLVNLAYASVNTAKKTSPGALYKSGTNGIGEYAKALEGMCIAEHENICSIFTRQDWSSALQLTCQVPMAELARTIRELNNHIKAHLHTDCFLAYEIVEIMSNLSSSIEERTGELKSTLAAALKPVRETAKVTLGELLDDTRQKAGALQTLPSNGAPIPLISETMQRLQTMVEFLRPISSIMISLGDGGWKSAAAANRATDAIPSLASFDIGADGKEIFAHYCTDTIEALLSALDQKARMLLKGKSAMGVFLANSLTIIERMIAESGLAPLLEGRLGVLETWRKKAKAMYTEACKDLSMQLFDVIHTNRAQRPTSGSNESASILKALSSKDKESIKGKFQAFNTGFDELVTRHKLYSMEREVRNMFAKDIQQMLEPLYNRFWDRYHEIDKGKGKYVKYDKSSISAVFLSLY